MNRVKLPDITVIVTGHNEESTIEDAVRSVLNQDYDGSLEIILSDDCSSDGTYGIMQRIAGEYKGRHSVVLNRNDSVLGLGPHILRAAAMASHEWILRQDGDDCSFPWRCRVFGEAFLAHPGAGAFMTRQVNVHEEPGIPFAFPPFPGEPSGKPAMQKEAGAYSCHPHYSCSMMIRREIYCQIPLSRMTLFFEDDLIGLEAWLAGDIYHVDEELYFYRFSLKNVCAISSMMRFEHLQTALSFEERDRNMFKKLRESKETGLARCEEALASGDPVFRSRQELENEIRERRKAIETINHQINWWDYPLVKRWRLRNAVSASRVKCLPRFAYVSCMVLFFRLRKIKRSLCKAAASQGKG